MLIAEKVPHPVPPPLAGEGEGGGIPGQILSGKLERKNASLAEAERALTVKEVEFSLHTRGKCSFWATEKGTGAQAASFYKARFAQGATIVPRSFWFVQVKPSPLGFDPHQPPLETDSKAIKEAKAPYRDVKFEGNVENRILYATLLSTDLLPFEHLDYRLVVLPIEPEEDQYKLLDANEARKRGFLHLARWLEKVEVEWAKRRSAKAERVTAIGWLDYRKKLTSQNPQAKYRVIYPLAATYICAAVITSIPTNFPTLGQAVPISGLLIDHALYCFETDDQNEAHFLAAILNAPEIDARIKPMQARGLFGPHDIHKKVLEFPIPQFNSENSSHRQLAELGKDCTAKVERWLAGGGAGNIKSIGRLRGMVREVLKDELKEIDELVKKILG